MILANIYDLFKNNEIAVFNKAGVKLAIIKPNQKINNLVAWLDIEKIIATDNHKLLMITYK